MFFLRVDPGVEAVQRGTHSSAGGHLECFQFLVIKVIPNANIAVQVFEGEYLSPFSVRNGK